MIKKLEKLKLKLGIIFGILISISGILLFIVGFNRSFGLNVDDFNIYWSIICCFGGIYLFIFGLTEWLIYKLNQKLKNKIQKLKNKHKI